jgi:hypothetical protein
MEIPFAHTYQGVFEHVGTVRGVEQFESAQRAAADATVSHLAEYGFKQPPTKPAEFELNTVKWGVDQVGHLTGTAKFFSIQTHDIVHATLEGESPAPKQGKDYREARVQVSFTGGTGRFAKAGGRAEVIAKLYNSGLTVGHIKGAVTAL